MVQKVFFSACPFVLNLFVALMVWVATPEALASPIDGKADLPLTIVRHRWQEKITESNHAALRPGSIYDISTYFEQNFGIARPRFNYYFFDTGLGATDPVYPVFQSGFQENWAQLIKAGASDHVRHIDHSSEGTTPEGCVIKSTYWVRHVDEFPEMYQRERADGYTLVDISFDYYLKLRPDAQCGKHAGHEASENFDPFASIRPYAKTFRTFADIPPELLAKYEAKVGILKLVSEEFNRKKWPRFAQAYSLKDNSMWFYPDGFDPDFGLRAPRTIGGLSQATLPRHLYVDASEGMAREFALPRRLTGAEFAKILDFLNGRPTPDFDAANEPGADTLFLSQVTPKNFYSSGIHIEPIRDVTADVSNPEHFKLVSIVLRPAEPEADVHFDGLKKIPQVRFVYQLMDPRQPGRPLEQMFLHLIYDAVDRLAAPDVIKAQEREFLEAVARLAEIRDQGGAAAEFATAEFLHRFAHRPVEMISFSSSLTGIWVFGALSRAYNPARDLLPMRIVREGVDVGYYSTAYDTVLFRDEIKRETGSRKERLQKILADLTPEFYRDPRRHDPAALTFQRVTCAQCHQMAGRDGVHVGFNDHIDRRITTPSRTTEYLFRELDRQLQDLSGAASR